MAGSNPMAAQALLCSTGRASLLRRRAKGVVSHEIHSWLYNVNVHTVFTTLCMPQPLQFFCLLCVSCWSLQDADRFANPALYSHEHAMAKLVAYKHLPPSLELPDSTPPPAPVPSPKIPTGLMPTTPTSANPV